MGTGKRTEEEKRPRWIIISQNYLLQLERKFSFKALKLLKVREGVCVCVCVRKLSTSPGKRVPAVCQPNGQKLGHSELFSSFFQGKGDASSIFPLEKKKKAHPALTEPSNTNLS